LGIWLSVGRRGKAAGDPLVFNLLGLSFRDRHGSPW
jgi:hypothetical protein